MGIDFEEPLGAGPVRSRVKKRFGLKVHYQGWQGRPFEFQHWYATERDREEARRAFTRRGGWPFMPVIKIEKNDR